MTEWNWFFTAIAQCNAAIVGFFGGFIINKILNMENEKSILEHSITETKIDILTQIEILHNIPFNIYNNINFCRTLTGDSYKSFIIESINDKIDPKDKETNLRAIFSTSEYDSFERIRDIVEKDIKSIKEKNSQSSPFNSTWFKVLGYVYQSNEKDETFCKNIQKTILEETIKTRRLADKITEVLSLVQGFPKNKEIIIFTLIFLCILFGDYPLTTSRR